MSKDKMSKDLEKMKLHSPDFADENIRKIAEIFPNCVTETQDSNGSLKFAIDYEELRQELSDHIVEGSQERYHLNWPGKREALLAANAPITKTLRPVRDESVEFDTTQNLFIEGDNLESLKLLQKSYLGKVKMIYIDPPYNTGKDRIYKDNFAERAEDFLLKSEQTNSLGERLVSNTDANGRFHSDWLSMMYPRLKIANRLLHNEGLIFVSIGQEEVASLRKLMDNVFGAENYRNCIYIRRGAKSVQAQFETWDKLGAAFEYVLFYSKKPDFRFPKLNRLTNEPTDSGWNNHWRGTDRPTMRYELFGQTPPTGQWRWQKSRSQEAALNYSRMISDIGKPEKDISQEEIDSWYSSQEHHIDLLRINKNNTVEHYLPASDTTLLNDSWAHINSGGSASIKKIFGTSLFDNPKSLSLLNQCLAFIPSNAILMDFFAGSGTTAHAAMQLNAEDGGNRQCISVQIPEKIANNDKDQKSAYDFCIENNLEPNIAEISKERIRRAGARILEGKCHPDWKKDIGFRVLKVDESNMRDVYYRPDEFDQKDILSSVDNIKPDRTGEDLLFQVLVDWGVDLTLPIRHQKVEGKSVYFVDDDALIACFETGINEELVKKLATHKPLRVVFRDKGFESDDLKVNITQIFLQASPKTDVKVI